jgi:hypothetical protein
LNMCLDVGVWVRWGVVFVLESNTDGCELGRE